LRRLFILVTKVLIIDDSVIVRSVLADIIDSEPGFEVVGKARDPFEAREMIFDKKPDILTLDVEMPRLDGISFLKSLMQNYPLPVVMVSSLTDRTSKKGMQALELGAVDVVGKPSGDSRSSVEALKEQLIPKLQAAAEADVRTLKEKKKDVKKKVKKSKIKLPSKVDAIVIGSSTGGTKALREVFADLAPGLPPILICQHMPPMFTTHFAKGLNDNSALKVWEAKDGDRVGKGEAILAPGDQHMVVAGRSRSDGVPVSLNTDNEVNFQRPAVDPLFETAARWLGDRALGIVLTGMGKDGAAGAVEMAKIGATILTQDKATSTVYGMPKQAKEAVKSAQQIPLNEIAAVLSNLA